MDSERQKLAKLLLRDIREMEHAYDERKIEQAEAMKANALRTLEKLECLLKS